MVVVVVKDLLDDVAVVVGAGLVRGSWVEFRRSRYVVVKGIPEVEWLKDGLSKLKGGDGGSVWCRRAPVVIRRVDKAGDVRVAEKVELLSGEAAVALFKGGVVFLRFQREVKLAVRGGGARVPCPVNEGKSSVRGCYGYGSVWHL